MSTTRTAMKAVVFALAGAVVVYFAVGQALANEWTVATERELPVPPQRVAERLLDLGSWARWASVDANLGPQTQRSATGTAGSAGQTIEWRGSRGTARLTLTAVREGALEYSFGYEFDGQPQPAARSGGEVEWRADGDGTRLVWRDVGVWDSLPGRWIGWFGALQQHVQQMQVASLEGLRRDLEARAPAGSGAAVRDGAAAAPADEKK